MNRLFFYIFIVLEFLIILFYGLFTRFGPSTELSLQTSAEDNELSLTEMIQFYPSYQDIHVMIFVGFGFLMSFLRQHSWSSIGFNFLSAIVAVQLYPLIVGFWDRVLNLHPWDEYIEIKLEKMIFADFAAGAVLITLGGNLGQSNLHEFLVISCIEVIGYSLNEVLGFYILKASDTGGSMIIHTFGAVFGVTYGLLNRPRDDQGKILYSHPDAEGSYATNTHAFIGTLFLYLFWPSFNSAPSLIDLGQPRSVICTILSLTGSCIVTFLLSFCIRRQFNMDDILNATLAGGVIIGSSADLIMDPFAALLVGVSAGIISTLGFAQVGPWLTSKVGLYDSCGISWLHAVPGILGGIYSAIFIGAFTRDRLGVEPSSILPDQRSPHDQASIQIAVTFISIGISIGTAIVSHIVIKIFSNSIGILTYKELYHDRAHYFAGDFHGDWHGEHKNEHVNEEGVAEIVERQPILINNDSGQTEYILEPRPKTAFQAYWNVEIV